MVASGTQAGLADTKVVQASLDAFHAATGLPVRCVGAEPGRPALRSWGRENAFCALLASYDPGKAAGCMATHLTFRRLANETGSAQLRCCPLGLAQVTLPVGGVVVEAGRVLLQAPESQNLRRLLEAGSGGLRTKEWECLAAAYGRLPVVGRDRLVASMHLLERLLQPAWLPSGKGKREAADDPKEPVELALQIIRQDPSEPLTLGEIARRLKLSPEHLCRLFHRKTGTTLTRHLAAARVSRAKQLLSGGKLRITDVAYAAGFQSIWQFNHLFKRHTGLSPSEYRASGSSMAAEVVSPTPARSGPEDLRR